MTQKILMVDDEQKVLDGYERNFGLDYEVITESDPRRALARFQEEGPFAVALSDYKMPEMDGVTFLSRVRELSKDTVRVMLTGFADLEKSMRAVNEGSVFRFLTKPCPLPELKICLNDALRQYDLVTAERELLDKTLKGSVESLLEILSLIQPRAFNLARKRRTAARTLGQRLGCEDLWSLEMAAMLCEIGIVTLPDDAVEAYLTGLKPAGQKNITERVSQASSHLLERIPRLEKVCQIIRQQGVPYRDETGDRIDRKIEEDALPMGSRILRALNDYFQLTRNGHKVSEALDIIEYSSYQYDPRVVSTMRKVAIGDGSEKGHAGRVVTMRLSQLIEGYTLRSDVRSMEGDLILRAGQTLGKAHIQRLRNFSESVGVEEPFVVET